MLQDALELVILECQHLLLLVSLRILLLLKPNNKRAKQGVGVLANISAKVVGKGSGLVGDLGWEDTMAEFLHGGVVRFDLEDGSLFDPIKGFVDGKIEQDVGDLDGKVVANWGDHGHVRGAGDDQIVFGEHDQIRSES